MAILQHQTFDKLAQATKIILSGQIAGNSVLEVERVAIGLKSKTITVVYRCNGKRVSAFIAKSAFSGYHWNLKDNWAECFNLSNGNLYRVSARGCTCPDYVYRRAPKGTSCKHQDMYAVQLIEAQQQQALNTMTEQTPAPKPKVIATFKPNEIPAGFRAIQDDEDWINLSYLIEIKVIRRVKGVPMTQWLNIGRIKDNCQGELAASTSIGTTASRFFKCPQEALKYLLLVSGNRRSDIDEALKLEERLDAAISVRDQTMF